MSRSDELLREEDGLFGPGWDLAISLIAVLVLAVAIEAVARRQDQRVAQGQQQSLACKLGSQADRIASLETDLSRHQRHEHEGELEIRAIMASQLRLVGAIANHYGTVPRQLSANVYGITIDAASTLPDITVRDEATLQRISFGSHVLFKSDDVVLLPEGAAVLQAFSTALQGELDAVKEIGIQGHADLLTPRSFPTNLELAARRAMTVFFALQRFGIDPARSIMSATSFGEFVPVARGSSGEPYSMDRLRLDNASPAQQSLNRRIEIVLIYRQ
jgi:outer membrane protein OmpA-like peptidoglycan-associated protein